jgi:hypothetical protein
MLSRGTESTYKHMLSLDLHLSTRRKNSNLVIVRPNYDITEVVNAKIFRWPQTLNGIDCYPHKLNACLAILQLFTV